MLEPTPYAVSAESDAEGGGVGQAEPTIVWISGRGFDPFVLWDTAKLLASVRRETSVELRLAEDAWRRVETSRAFVDRHAGIDAPAVYGVNTGVGALKSVAISHRDLAQLQLNVLRSHACGVGEPLSREIVAAMWLCLLDSAARGTRGLHRETIERILLFVNRGVFAVVPSRGSVGASGDLVPAAHAALALVGEADCTAVVGSESVPLPAADVLDYFGISPIQLRPKEALALINGTQLTTALACQVLWEARNLWRAATLAVALSTFGFRTTPTTTSPELLRQHHPSSLFAGMAKQAWFDGVEMPLRNHEQDPYCFRCASHVHGAIWDEIETSARSVASELRATADNPVVDVEAQKFLHGGNFHAIYPARVLDRLASALTTLASISERRCAVGMSGRHTGLPDFLVENGGLNSGLMMLQTTAAALVSECKSLSFPASVDSIPTNCDQEDHVSMGPIAGLKAVRICENVRFVVAIEILSALQACRLRGVDVLPPRLRGVVDRLGAAIAPIDRDRAFARDISIIAALVQRGVLTDGDSIAEVASSEGA